MAYDSFQRELNEIVQNQKFPVEFRAAPICELLSSRIDKLDIAGGECKITFVTDERFLHGGGVVQGGIVSAMLDIAMAILLLADLEEGYSIGTTNLNVEFLRPAPAGDYTCTATTVRKGRSIAFTRSELHDDAGNHIASATATNVVFKMKT